MPGQGSGLARLATGLQVARRGDQDGLAVTIAAFSAGGALAGEVANAVTASSRAVQVSAAQAKAESQAARRTGELPVYFGG